jgi:hypothetical protein
MRKFRSGHVIKSVGLGWDSVFHHHDVFCHPGTLKDGFTKWFPSIKDYNHEANKFLYFIIYPVSGMWLSTHTQSKKFQQFAFSLNPVLSLPSLFKTPTDTHMLRTGNFRAHLRTFFLSMYPTCPPCLICFWISHELLKIFAERKSGGRE